MSKRGQAHKVDEKFMSRCNQDGESGPKYGPVEFANNVGAAIRPVADEG